MSEFKVLIKGTGIHTVWDGTEISNYSSVICVIYMSLLALCNLRGQFYKVSFQMCHTVIV